MRKWAITLIATILLSSNVAAQQVYYVNDELTITMRSGESTQHQIIRTLKSGTRLNIIETHKETGYSLARTDSGTEGWVLTRYLSTEPAARDQLPIANNTIKQLKQELAELRTDLKENINKRSSSEKTGAQLAKENQALSEELQQIKDTARNAIAINNDNKTLREKLIHMETELQSLEQQNSVLQDRNARDWFITGMGVTVIGILIGLIVPRIRLQRKSKWNEL